MIRHDRNVTDRSAAAEDIVLSLPNGSLMFPLGTPPATLRAYLAEIAPSDRVAYRGAGEASPFMTAVEAAEYLRFPVKRIYNLTARAEIPHRKQEGRLVFKRDELDRWMDEFYAGPPWAGPQE